MRRFTSNFLRYHLTRGHLLSPMTGSSRTGHTRAAQRILPAGPGLKEFLVAGKNFPAPNKSAIAEDVPYLSALDISGQNRKVFFEVYGCQMNVSDTEVVWSILKGHDYQKVEDFREADVVLLITCAIREGAETKIWNRLQQLSLYKSKRKSVLQIGILGCMAERLKTQVLEKERLVDVVAGPDSYKDLPRLLAVTRDGQQSAVNVLLSLDETYADVTPIRLNSSSVTAFVSIMRGCDNMCSYCIVPFTRGRERSRPMASIEEEVKLLESQGVREITLLGQNVNSYRDLSMTSSDKSPTTLAPGFKTVYKPKLGGARFEELLERIAEAVPEVRIRFTSPHPKDFPEEVLRIIQKHPNICNNLHLPAQSGSSAVLERMRRGYTREAYLELIDRVRSLLPGVALSSDFILGFCGETEEDFAETLSLIEAVQYNVAYIFPYSMREKTTAHRRFQDDIPDEVKRERMARTVEVFRKSATEANRRMIGQEQVILIEGDSKRSQEDFYGRNDGNIKVIIPKGSLDSRPIAVGDYIAVKIHSANSQVLKGTPLRRTSLNRSN
ncbi:CDK5RAP1-like protein [Phlebotomus argentipes]|uniref:CDK5RAP1-like protein n=1 Tax=Phlebotomus argentipes TaxID=94469 RepID=UPI00289311AA|nr:CDK5RAP1-like protein [Phlebotomus argentipes]